LVLILVLKEVLITSLVQTISSPSPVWNNADHKTDK